MQHITESINGIAIIENNRYEGLIIFDEYRIIFRGEQYQCAVTFDWSSAKCSVAEETITRLGLIKRKQARYHLYDQHGHYFDFIDTASDYDDSINWIQGVFINNKKHAVDRNHTAQMQEEQRQEIERLARETEEAEARRIAEENRIKEVQEAETARLNEIREAKIREEMQLQAMEKENKAREEELHRLAEALRVSEENKFKEAQEAEKERLNEIREAKKREEMQLQMLKEQAEQRRLEEERLAKEREEAEAKRIEAEKIEHEQNEEQRRREEGRLLEEKKLLEEEIQRLKEQVADERAHLDRVRDEIAKNEARIAQEAKEALEKKERFEKLEKERKEEEERFAKEREEARIARQKEKEAAERAEEERLAKEKKEKEEHERQIRVAQEREQIKKQKIEDALREEDKKKRKELQNRLRNTGHEQHKKLVKQEEAIKDNFYRMLKQKTREAEKKVDDINKRIKTGNFATGTLFMAHQDLNEAMDALNRCIYREKNLNNKPYFSHMAVLADQKDKEEYFLSDNENLDEYVPLGQDRYLLPFKKDSARPIITAIRRCHMEKNGTPVPYNAEDGSHIIEPQLICDVSILNKALLDVVQQYPTPEEFHIESDELLADRLEENRNDPKLSNIISTLQLQQFEIIETDVDKSFVVQGCPGSGKSQCLIHRLFFLRDELSETGWDKVLMITPTKLFRHFSRELMKRYQLTDIYDCSISELYIELLNTYDRRFKERQYIFQLTEEYLPDDYLYEIYAEDNVRKIAKEIDNAILQYVSQACSYLDEKVPNKIDIDLINGLTERLTKKISDTGGGNKTLDEDEKYQEYQTRKKEYEESIKEIESLLKKQARFQDELEEVIEEKEEYIKAFQLGVKLKDQRTEDVVSRANDIREAFGKYEGAKETYDRSGELAVLESFKELVRSRDRDTRDENIDNYIDFITAYDRRRATIESQITKGIDLISEKAKIIEDFVKWAEDNPYDMHRSDKGKARASITQVRYYLSRIESTVFEQEVWNVMAPIKKRYEIPTIDIEVLGEGKRKENRILYKSDLLFYVMIYMKLYPKAKLPDYSLICIDEGQDLHRADYEILKKLYQRTTFNVFGDIGQVLHEACGISDWREQTGIAEVFPLMTNYRNTAAIVDFCNHEFSAEMEYIGKPDNSSKPIVVTELEIAKELLEEEDMVVIVKDRDAYIELCDEMGIIPEDYAFLDTTAEKSDGDDKECYSIYAAKGLEFSNVFVFANNMSTNQRVVACTRAMNKLYYYSG